MNPIRLPAPLRWLVAALPTSFRDRHEPGLTRSLVRRLAAARRISAVHGWLVMGRATIDTARTVVALRAGRFGLREEGGRGMDAIVQEFRFAVRRVRAEPGYALVFLLSLGTAVAASAVVFSMLRETVLDPIPYDDPGELIVIWESRDGEDISVAWPNFVDWRDAVSTADLAAYGRRTVNATGDDAAALQLRGLEVTDGLFRVLGVEPLLGRTPRDGEQSVLLTHALWRDRYAGAPDVLGREIRLDGEPWTVVGVLPEGIRFPDGIILGASDLFIPLDTSDPDYANRGSHPGLTAIARLRPGVEPEALRQELDAVGARLAQAYPETNGRSSIASAPAARVAAGDARSPLLLLAGALAFLLLAAVANVSGMALTRATARDQEWALRAALGAGGRDVVRAALVEGALYGVLTGALGLAAAAWAVSVLPEWRPLSYHGISFEVGVTDVLVGVVVAIGGALTVAATPVVASLRSLRGNRLTEGLRTTRRGGVRAAIVTFQIAITTVLVVGSVLLGRSLDNIERADGGLDPRGVYTFRVGLPELRYEAPGAAEAFYGELLTELGAVPGVTSVGGISTLPFSGAGAQSGIEPFEGTADDRVRTDVNVVFDDYFEAAGVELVAGRVFDERDGADAPVAVVVDERFAARFWPDRSPLGERVRGWGFQEAEVVGVVRHVKNYGVTRESREELYVGHRQRPYRNMWVFVRTEARVDGLTEAVRGVVGRIDTEVPIQNVSNMEDVVAGTVTGVTLAAGLGTAFALFTVFIAMIGLRTLIAYGVRLRAREFGIRMALGSERGAVRRAVLGQTLRLAVAGVVVGAAGAVVTSRAVESLVFGVGRLDPTSYLIAAASLVLLALLAGDGPARSASSVDPQEVLRGE